MTDQKYKVHVYASDGRTNAMIECEAVVGGWIAMDEDGEAKMASFKPTDVHEVQFLDGDKKTMRDFVVTTTYRRYYSDLASDAQAAKDDKPEAAPKVEWLSCNEGYTFHRDPNLPPRTMKILDDAGNVIAIVFGIHRIHLGPLPR